MYYNIISRLNRPRVQAVMTVTMIGYHNLLFWMSFPSALALGGNVICNKVPGLSPRQRTICRSRPDAMAIVGAADQLALDECRFQFRHHRWNCSFIGATNTSIGITTSINTKEMAFYHGIRSAAIAHSIALACSQGQLHGCGCDRTKIEGTIFTEGGNVANASRKTTATPRSTSHPPSVTVPRGGAKRGVTAPSHSATVSPPSNAESPVGEKRWKWGGCSVDVKHGVRFAQTFLDSKETEEDSRTLMNLHNNRAGRKAVSELVSRTCRCNGVAGSCALQTCWTTLPPFRSIGDLLFSRYSSPRTSRQVIALRGERSGKAVVLKLKGAKRPDKKPRRSDLVYLDGSPDFCDFEPSRGAMGTRGRACNKTSESPGGCDTLCCGRVYTTRQYTRTWQCNCTFTWCCHVTCHSCSERLELYSCS